jgi:hypothetical protein
MPKQKFDLLKIATVLAAKLRAGASQIVSSEGLDSNLLRGFFHDRPDRPICQGSAFDLSALEHGPQQPAALDLTSYHPGIDGQLDPDRNRHSANPAPLAAKIYDHPATFAHLDLCNIELGTPHETEFYVR